MKQAPFWSGKKILITGACGTIGQRLVTRLLQEDITEVVAFDNNESGIFTLQQIHRDESRFDVVVGDVRSASSLKDALSGINIVFHGAAQKHVHLSERYPDQTVATNITGVQNLIAAAMENAVDRVIFMSSDKAVNPTNVMGTSKLMGERLMTSANFLKQNRGTIFSSTRFGNVLGSRGSAVPLFLKQMQGGKDITLTDQEMTRFVMTMSESVELLLKAACNSSGGEIFVTKMPVQRIVDMIEALKTIYAPQIERRPEDIKTSVIGTRPGEKQYEELLSTEELHRTSETEDFFVVRPTLHKAMDPQVKRPEKEYRSDLEPAQTVEEIVSYFLDHGLLDQIDY